MTDLRNPNFPWIAHAVLLCCTLAPLVVPVPYNVSIVLHACLTVYTGSWRSIKPVPPAEPMTDKDAMRFPIVGSAVLLSLFLMFKFLPKEIVNAILTVYIVALGVTALVGTLLPFVLPLFPERLREREISLPKIPKIPFLVSEPIELKPTVPEVVLLVPCLGLCAWYFMKKHWIANNLLGLSFSIVGIEHISIGSTQTAGILLVGLFFYDIFWVFATPVMVGVAKNFDAPIKLLFPRSVAATGGLKNFAMLGLGDIVIPGLWVALMLRYDASHNFSTTYFQSAFWGYTAGLGTTIFVMNYFQAAQPALLYIVPCVLGAVGLHALVRGELRAVYAFKEGPDEDQAEDKVEDKAEDKEGDKKTQ